MNGHYIVEIIGNNSGLVIFNMANETQNETTTSPDLHYPGAEALQTFDIWYKEQHGYLASAICILGIIMNVLNIIVLTRCNMVSVTNCILTGLAISDGLTMMAYLPFALRFYCLYGTDMSAERNSLTAVRFLLFYACFSVVVHSVSIWLTVILALFRYIFIRYPGKAAELCNLQKAKIAVFLVYIIMLLVCMPNFLTISVQRVVAYDNNNTSDIWIVGFKKDTEKDRIVHNLNFWIQAILVKLLPCTSLVIISVLLVKTMRRADKKRRILQNKDHRKRNRRGRTTNRTTIMLLTVVILFLLTEFPQGVLNLLSGILTNRPNFIEEIYKPLGDLMDILALLNNGINFILYCTMSKQFRNTFIKIFFSSLKNQGRRIKFPSRTTTDSLSKQSV